MFPESIFGRVVSVRNCLTIERIDASALASNAITAMMMKLCALTRSVRAIRTAIALKVGARTETIVLTMSPPITLPVIVRGGVRVRVLKLSNPALNRSVIAYSSSAGVSKSLFSAFHTTLSRSPCHSAKLIACSALNGTEPVAGYGPAVFAQAFGHPAHGW